MHGRPALARCHGTLLVIINQFHVICVAASPDKAGPPLVVDPDTPLTGAIAAELLEPIAGRHPQVVGPGGGIEDTELPEPRALNVRAHHSWVTPKVLPMLPDSSVTCVPRLLIASSCAYDTVKT